MHLPQKNSNPINFRPATVRKGKEIRVEYYCRSPFTGALKRYQIRLNYLKMSVHDKVKYAENVAMEINNKLQNGWNPALDLESNNQYTSLSKAYKDFIRMHCNNARPDTIRMYMSMWKVFSGFTFKAYKTELYVVQVNKEVSSRFIRYLIIDRKVTNKTHNNYLNGLNSIFNWFVNQGYHTYNPFSHIKRKKPEMKRRLYITRDDLKIISEHFSTHYPEYHALMMTSLLTLLRRKELTMLKVENILLKKSLLFVPAEISKNGKDYHVTIPAKLKEIFEKMELHKYPGHYYVFSKNNLQPGAYSMPPKYISDQWVKMRKALDVNPRYQFMSLRDTGIRMLVQNRVPLDDVMKHARHSSLEITKTYLLHEEAHANINILNALDF